MHIHVISNVQDQFLAYSLIPLLQQNLYYDQLSIKFHVFQMSYKLDIHNYDVLSIQFVFLELLESVKKLKINFYLIFVFLTKLIPYFKVLLLASCHIIFLDMVRLNIFRQHPIVHLPKIVHQQEHHLLAVYQMIRQFEPEEMRFKFKFFGLHIIYELGLRLQP